MNILLSPWEQNWVWIWLVVKGNTINRQKKCFQLTSLSKYFVLAFHHCVSYHRVEEIREARMIQDNLSSSYFPFSLAFFSTQEICCYVELMSRSGCLNRIWWRRMGSLTSWMPATPVQSQTSSARTTSCAFPSTTATVKSCCPGWRKPTNSLVRIFSSEY